MTRELRSDEVGVQVTDLDEALKHIISYEDSHEWNSVTTPSWFVSLAASLYHALEEQDKR